MTVNEHLWDFPHAMTLKVMGAADAPLEQLVIAVLDQHLEEFDPDGKVRLVPSSKGNFVSVNVEVIFHNKDQVAAIYAALNASEHVKVVF